ncbi:MAG TPA: hypothetical protein VHX18_03215 [Rhizomicrobium sp.]|jgi:hypothetical protein|nr:hypothetical protein [Rhizomicrobium sp.]
MQNLARIMASLGMAWALFSAGPAPAQTTTIAVIAAGNLPGFRTEDAGPWLAARMAEAGLDHWRFVSGDPAHAPPNRIEWDFEVLPYAGGEVRRFFPMAESQGPMDVHIQGRHHLISAEAKLFLDGEYQTVTLAQQAVKGGAEDQDLIDFIISTTRMLDNAWHAIDLTPAEHNHGPH